MVYFTVVFWTTKYKPWENYNLWFYAYTPGDVFSSQVLWDGPDLASQLAGAGDLVSKFKGVFLQVGLQLTYHSMSKKKKNLPYPFRTWFLDKNGKGLVILFERNA